jgi:small subunit ribosomal protein S6
VIRVRVQQQEYNMEQMAQKNCYEGMFLLDAGQPNMETALEPVRNVLERSEAEVLSLKPWDERRLAYEIEGRKRGLYVLGYFKLDPDKVVELEHDCMLNDGIIRMMVLRKESISDAELQAATPAESAPEGAGRSEDDASKDSDSDDDDSRDDSDDDSDDEDNDDESTD